MLASSLFQKFFNLFMPSTEQQERKENLYHESRKREILDAMNYLYKKKRVVIASLFDICDTLKSHIDSENVVKYLDQLVEAGLVQKIGDKSFILTHNGIYHCSYWV